MVGYLLEGGAVVDRGSLEAPVVGGVHEHDGLARAHEEVVYVGFYLLAVEGVPAVEEAVKAVGEYEVEDFLFYLLVRGIHEEVVQGSEYGDVAVALESLRYDAAEYLLLEVDLTLGDYDADKDTIAHSCLLYAR